LSQVPPTRQHGTSLADPARAHLRVIDVAVEPGFVNVASFHRAFRREFGTTPAQLRASAGVLPARGRSSLR
jgi:AraC family transcriptional activator of tynA and feaB